MIVLSCVLASRIPLSSRLLPIAGDGNCLFAAISAGLSSFNGLSLSADHLRQLCVRTIRARPELQSRFYDEFDLLRFCDAMERPGEYGDELCIRSLALALQISFIVVQPHHPEIRFGDYPCFVQVAFNGVNHYDAIVARTCTRKPKSPLFPNPAPFCVEPAANPRSRLPLKQSSFSKLHNSTAGSHSPSEEPPPPECLQGELTVLSANITSWQTRFDVFAKSGAHVLCFQETRLDIKQIARAQASCRRAGQRFVFGRPVSQQGGVAIVSHSPLAQFSCPHSLQPWVDAGRITAAWVPLGHGHRAILVVCAYGIPGAHAQKDPIKFNDNELFLSEIFLWLATFGKIPCLLCADFNIDPSTSPACTAACVGNTWHDLGAEAGAAPTFFAIRHKKPVATRIDSVFFTACTRSFVSSFGVKEFDIPNHRALMVSLSFPAFNAKIKVSKAPKPFPSVCDDADRFSLCQDAFTSRQSAWDAVCKSGSIDDIWEFFCSSCHAFLFSPGAGQENGSTARCDRGLAPRLRSRYAFPAQGSCSSLSVKLSRLFRLQRQIQECCTQLARRGYVEGDLESAVSKAFQSLCVGIQFDGYQNAAVCVKNEIQCEQQLAERNRIRAWKNKMQSNWSSGKALVFKWIRMRKATLSSPEFFSSSQGLCFARGLLLSKVVDKWSKIYRSYDKTSPPSWDAFFARYGQYLVTYDVSLPNLDANRLKRIACGSGSKAAGLDSWNTDAFREWPDEVWDRLCHFLTLVEKFGVWPNNLLHVLVTLIPKPHGSGPEDLRPITLASKIYRAWATVRARDLASWQSQWALPEIYGGVRGRRASDLYLRVALELEHACSSGAPVAILLLDLSKFFDRLPWSIEYGLLHHFGCPAEVSKPKRHMASGAARWFRLGNAVAPPIDCTNGTPQGCPLSIVSINALMTVWVRVLRSEISDVRCGTFIDDRSIRALSRPALDTMPSL